MRIIHWIGIDDHADRWTVAVYEGSGREATSEFELVPSESGYRKLIGYCKGLEGEVRIVYEAGPCGYELCRRLRKAGLSCEVAAPSLTPRKPGDRVKTNRRDANKLAKYYRSGDLTLISVPDEKREALRDLVRTRQATRKDVGSLQHQVTKLILRYGHRYREGKAWTLRFWRWLKSIQLEGDSQFALEELLIALKARQEQLARFDAAIEAASQRPEYASYISALRTVRGFDTLASMVVLSELGDLRRFASAPELMAAVGVVPSEASTGEKSTRLSITKTGNAHVRHVVVEAAWHYQRRVDEGRTIQRRRRGQPQQIVEIARKCELRLHRRFHRLTNRGKRSTVAVVAVGRELLGFLWAIGQVIHP